MDKHVKRLAVCTMLFGIAATVGALMTLAWFGGFAGVLRFGQAQGLGLVPLCSVGLHLFVGVPSIAAGFFLGRFEEWARWLMIFLSAINLLNPPFGSILGAYALWVLMLPETEPLFTDKPHTVKKSSRRKTPMPDAAPEQGRALNITDPKPHLPE